MLLKNKIKSLDFTKFQNKSCFEIIRTGQEEILGSSCQCKKGSFSCSGTYVAPRN